MSVLFDSLTQMLEARVKRLTAFLDSPAMRTDANDTARFNVYDVQAAVELIAELRKALAEKPKPSSGTEAWVMIIGGPHVEVGGAFLSREAAESAAVATAQEMYDDGGYDDADAHDTDFSDVPRAEDYSGVEAWNRYWEQNGEDATTSVEIRGVNLE